MIFFQIINKGTNFAATKQLSKVWKTKIFNIESTHTAVAAATKSNQEFLSSSPYSNLFFKKQLRQSSTENILQLSIQKQPTHQQLRTQ